MELTYVDTLSITYCKHGIARGLSRTQKQKFLKFKFIYSIKVNINIKLVACVIEEAEDSSNLY